MARPSIKELLQQTLLRIEHGGKWDEQLSPYCLHRAKDYFPGDESKADHFLLVNRGYDPISAPLPATDPIVQAALKVGLVPDPDGSVWFWNDGCNPSGLHGNKGHLTAYAKRIRSTLGA